MNKTGRKPLRPSLRLTLYNLMLNHHLEAFVQALSLNVEDIHAGLYVCNINLIGCVFRFQRLHGTSLKVEQRNGCLKSFIRQRHMQDV